MAGKKRRKPTAVTSKASAKRKNATVEATAAGEPIQIGSVILRHVLDIASSYSRTKNLLKVFDNGRCWTETKQVPTGTSITVQVNSTETNEPTPQQKTKGSNFDCYWIILATRIMNRLLALEDNDEVEKNHLVANYIIALADALVTILHSDSAKSFLLAHQMPSTCRSIVCKAVLTTSLALLYGIRKYDPQQQDQEKQNAYEVAVSTLDRLVHVRTKDHTKGTNDTDDGDDDESLDLFGSLKTVGGWSMSTLEAECDQIEELLGFPDGDSEHDCVKVLLDTVNTKTALSTTEPEASPPLKRSTRKRKGTAKKPLIETKPNTVGFLDVDPLPVVTAFQKLLPSERYADRIDGRVTSKRWASIALLWSERGDGQNIVLRRIHELATKDEYENLFTPFEKSRMMSTLIQVVVETGNQGGLRPPTGGIELYLKGGATGTEVKRKKAARLGKSKRARKSSGEADSNGLKRGDLRDWTTVVIHDYLKNYKLCLRATSESDEGDKVHSTSSRTSAFPSPNFSDLLTGLCRGASSSVQNTSYGEQISWNKTLLSIASAFCLQLTADSTIPLDSKVVGFALTQITDSLRSIDSQSNFGSIFSSNMPVGNKQRLDFEKKYLLRQDVPIPTPPTSTIGGDIDLKIAEKCDFAGVLPSDFSFTDEHAVALAIRAVQISTGPTDSSTTTGNFFAFLVDLVKRAYDTRKPNQKSMDNLEKDAKTGKRKRAAAARSNRRGSRRRKTGTGDAQQIHEQDDLGWNKICSEMANVAISALNAIRMCLMSKQRMGSCTLRMIIRSTVTVDHMLDLVNLGEMLDQTMIKSRCRMIGMNSDPDSTIPKGGPPSYQAVYDYNDNDGLLWNAHMHMCQVFGRGQLTHEANSGVDPIIWDSKKRIKVFEALTAPLSASSSDEVETKRALSLPAASHALLVANMSCVSNAEDKKPEKHIVQAYIESIVYVLDHLDILKPNVCAVDGRMLDDEIPLSYKDARTFVLALNALSHPERRVIFDRLVGSTTDALTSVQKKETFVRNAEASGFLARILVVCYSLLNTIVSGKEMEQKFLTSMGCAQIRMPSFVTKADWYRQERTFMSVFDTWQSPSVPDNVAGNSTGQNPISKKSLNDFRSLLETAFSVGFDTAPRDRCHLLFAAWNGLGQIPTEADSSTGQSAGPTPWIEDYPKKILELREELCSTYEAIDDGAFVDLAEMVSRVSEMIDSLLNNYVSTDGETKEEVPSSVMVLLASFPTFISAILAGHTKPGNDYFSTTMSKSSTSKDRRHRGYSSESDHTQPDCESDDDGDDYEDDARIEAMSRLRECCEAFGAAPVHPDWLDVSCSLRDGIRSSDATQVAEKALKTLSRLASVAFAQCKKHQSRSLKATKIEQKGVEKNADLCSFLLRWSRHAPDRSQYPKAREWQDDVATLTRFPKPVVDYLSEDVPFREVEQTKSCWCPHAGQKLRGHLQENNKLVGGWVASDAELRAGGEWELLLAEALSIASLNTHQPEDEFRKTSSKDSPETHSLISAETTSEMAKSQLWRSVFMSATSHLVPAAALLRLGLGKVGRTPHPFAFHENEQDPYEEAPLRFSESLNRVESYTTSSLKSSINETLGLLAMLSIEGEESLSGVCHAVASHLVVDTNTFLDLEGMYSIQCAFMALKLVSRIAESSPRKDVKVVIPLITERLVSIIEDSGRGENVLVTSDRSTSSVAKYRRLHHFLGDPQIHLVDTITTKSIDIFKVLKSPLFSELCGYRISPVVSKNHAVSDLVSILCQDTLRANVQTRAQVALILSRVGLMEARSTINSTTLKQPFFILAMIKAFDKVDKKHLKAVVLKDLCGVSESELPSKTFRRDMASIISLLLFTAPTTSFEKARFVHDTLLEAFESWKKIDRSHRSLTLNVLLTYGVFFSSLFNIGSKLIKQTCSVETDDVPYGESELLSTYFTSIKVLKSALLKKRKALPQTLKTPKTSMKVSPTDATANGSVLPSEFPRSCSFVQKSGFHGQHWYHCYTCNLIADKGCCTLCALVCHRDHDVAYSRHSSFFCDCAAEDGGSTDQGRVSCRCLSSVPGEELDAIFEKERGGKPLSTKTNDQSELENIERKFEEAIFVEVAKHSFGASALESIDKFLLDARGSGWLDSLLNVVRKEFKSWNTQYGDPIQSLLKTCSIRGFDPVPISRLSHESAQRRLSKRKARALELRKMEEMGLIPVREAMGFLSSNKYSSDSVSISRLSTRNDISRSTLAFDSRGRMILAEPSSLVFCSPMAVVNTRNSRRSQDSHLTKSQMCILGTASLSFDALGVRLCAENERHIAVWGTSEACVLVLKSDFTGIDDTIHLTFEVDEQDRDGDVLVNCEWLPGSQTHIAVGVSRYVRLFDICRFEKDANVQRAHPVIGYNLGFEASLRDLSIVPKKDHASNEGYAMEFSASYQTEHVSKMFLLLENGRLHSLDIKISNGKIESPTELHFEPNECVSISTEGIRPRSTSSVGLPGASTRTLGEGSKLVYLKQSRCLLYKCKSAAVVALMIGSDGNVDGTFELLPHSIPLNILSTDDYNEDYDDDEVDSICGPYTLWTELGMVYREGECFFRVACLGRATGSGNSKLLCIDFNEKVTKIKEIPCSLKLDDVDSFDGLAAFTAPIVHVDACVENRYMTGERSFLCALSSEGSLHIFGDNVIDMMPTCVGPDAFVMPSSPLKLMNISEIQSSPITKFPLTIFEQLTNVSDSERLLFAGNGLLYPKELKRLLSRDSSASFVCPRREGCCVTISLSQDTGNDTQSKKATTSTQDLVISAIRVLVGSNPEHMPSKISVQGRSIDITPRLKRWYNIPLTEEEVARGIRSGLVSLWIAQSFDPSNAPIVDSVEVFASERSSVELSIPRTYFPSTTTPELNRSPKMKERSSNISSAADEKASLLDDISLTSRALLLGVRASSNLCELIGPSIRVSDAGKGLLSQLIQVTAVHPEKQLGRSLNQLSSRLDIDSRSRWSFQDENMLVGCSRSLDECHSLLKLQTEEDLRWKAIKIVLQDCLKVSSLIARERPNNYLHSMGNMEENNLKSGSIAIEASTLILEGLQRSSDFEELIGGTRGIITLCLTEMAIIVYMDDSASTKDLTLLSLVRQFLDVANLSTCEAISMFFQDHESEQSNCNIPYLFVQMEAARRVAYQCDSCGLCPMKEVRYTILEEDYGIDLCKDCYEVGKKFASNKRNKASAEVVINGKRMGTKLTCAHMKKMEPVSLEKMEMDVEEVKVKSARQHELAESEGSLDEDQEMRRAVKLSLEENECDNTQQDIYTDHRGYEYFLGELFSFVMEQLTNAFVEERRNSSAESLIKLALDLVRHSRRESPKQERASRFVKNISEGISHILGSHSQKQKLSHYKMSILVTCLRGLSSLMIPESDSEFHFPGSKFIWRPSVSSGEKKVEFSCDVHGIPAVRRRCDKPGVNKDRRFYVCGKEKGQRCNYFQWAGDDQKMKDKSNPTSQFSQLVQTIMLQCVSSPGDALYDRLCVLLEEELFGEDGNSYEVSVFASNAKEKKRDDSLMKSLYNIQSMERDFNDGVFSSKGKLSDALSSGGLAKRKIGGTHDLGTSIRASGERAALLLEASLELLTHIADHKTDRISRWFSMLCEINMAANKNSSLRSLATKVLKTLCGGDRKKYHYVRDHFTFCFQLKRLYHFSYNILESAIIVKEKTRQCSIDWRSPPVEWSTLGVGDLIGTQDLIPEDSLTELNLKGCGRVLDDMWTIIKSRADSWRQFCGFESLPLSQRQSEYSDSQTKQNKNEEKLSKAAPIKVLFWIASSLSGINQVKVLRMIRFAIFDWEESKGSPTNNLGSVDEEARIDKESDDDNVVGIGSAIATPEELLLKSGSTKLGVCDVVTMSLHMIHSGKTSELRRITSAIVLKLSQAMSDEDRFFLFQNLIAAIGEIGMLGKACMEFMTLLQSLAHFLKPSSPIGSIADFVVDSFVQQLDAIKYDKSNTEWAVLEANVGSSVTKKKFDLSGCTFCLRTQHHSGGRDVAGKSTERGNQSTSTKALARSGSPEVAGRTGTATTRQKWHPKQVSSFSRCRLDTLKESCSSNEFNLFYKLKHRVLISDIHLTVSDPRGRYVKKISVFFTPRPTSDSLKNDSYYSKWQKIATLKLSKGGSRASASLSKPIVAANIRVEFAEFYERPGDKDKRSDGSMVLHCPRCTRPVTNAHGVCVTCGEVAFQCRKCRHINYDRLDAFLCVECGYTCCGSFSLELNAGVASNAIAITDDTVFDKSIEMYGTASSIHEGLKEKLGGKLRSLSQKKMKSQTSRDSLFDTSIERAFLGLLPDDEVEEGKDDQNLGILARLEKPGSVVKHVARPEDIVGGDGRSGSASDRSERTRSLLRLARQIRSDSASSSDRRRSTDIIIRHLGRGISLDSVDDENDLLEILDHGTNASAQARDQDSGDKSGKDKDKCQKADVESCQKLLVLLREASREVYELRRRIDAWKCLNSGTLVSFSPIGFVKDAPPPLFSPSHCSLCSGSIAFQLLGLWLKLYLVAPGEIHVGKEFFGILFQEDVSSSQCRGLQDTKKQVIISIATNSRNGAQMVLKELEKRLAASRDMYCADILGKIMEIDDFDMANKYAKLAMDTLSSRGDMMNIMQE